MPLFGEPLKGKLPLSPDAIFKVDLEKSQISVQQNGKTVDVGKQLTYLVQ